MSDPVFKIDENGNVVGPGFFLPASRVTFAGALARPVIILDIDHVNRLYELGRQAGRLEEATHFRRMRDRTESVKIIESPEPAE